MVKVIHRRYKAQFPEILSRASEHMEMVFGLVLKEVRPNSHCYTLVSNLDLSDSESMRGDWGAAEEWSSDASAGCHLPEWPSCL